MDKSILKEGERLDDLQLNGMAIISNPDLYCFTSDSVILANHVKCEGSVRIADLCTGGGIIAILLAAKTKAREIVGIELQPNMADMAERSVLLNNLSERVRILNADVKGIENTLGNGGYDIITCNPPYYKVGSGVTRECESVAIARHELQITAEEIILTASKLLKYGGKLYMIHKSERMAEIIVLLNRYSLEPKHISIISNANSKYSDTFIVEAKKGGKSGIKVCTISRETLEYIN